MLLIPIPMFVNQKDNLKISITSQITMKHFLTPHMPMLYNLPKILEQMVLTLITKNFGMVIIIEDHGNKNNLLVLLGIKVGKIRKAYQLQKKCKNTLII